MRELVSLWQKNVIAVIILLQVLVRMWWERVIKCKRIYNFAIGREDLTSFSVNIITVLIFLVKKSEMKLSGASLC